MKQAPIAADPGTKWHHLPPTDTAALAVITVTYHPDLKVLQCQLESLPASALKVVVDNASAPSVRSELKRLCAATPRCLLVENEVNRGLPAAINEGAQRAVSVSADCRYLLFLDQDTEPPPGAVAALLGAFLRLSESDARLGCVGPHLIDAATGLTHGFHLIAGWRWVRRFPEAKAPPMSCAGVNCSGTLLKTQLFLRLGGFDEALFLDHLDTEWCFRLADAGFSIYGVPAVAFLHRMGEASWRFWMGKWRIWPYRPPQRHFLLFRNAVRLMRRPYVPGVWKFWAAVKLLLTFGVHALFDRRRRQQLPAMIRGVRAGLKAGAG